MKPVGRDLPSDVKLGHPSTTHWWQSLASALTTSRLEIRIRLVNRSSLEWCVRNFETHYTLSCRNFTMENRDEENPPDPASLGSWSWMPPMSPGPADQQPYPTPNPFSPSFQAPNAPYTQPHPSTTSSSSSAPGSAFRAAPKVAIPRLAGSDLSLGGRRRSARACEPCRQRKIKCDGLRPSCGQCAYHNHRCSYEDVKRVRDQKRLGTLAKRVEAYEALLRELEGEVDSPTARQIRKVLQVSLFETAASKTPPSETRVSSSES